MAGAWRGCHGFWEERGGFPGDDGAGGPEPRRSWVGATLLQGLGLEAEGRAAVGVQRVGGLSAWPGGGWESYAWRRMGREAPGEGGWWGPTRLTVRAAAWWGRVPDEPGTPIGSLAVCTRGPAPTWLGLQPILTSGEKAVVKARSRQGLCSSQLGLHRLLWVRCPRPLSSCETAGAAHQYF